MTWIGIGTVVDMNGEPTNMRFVLVTTTDPETGGLKLSLIYVRARNFEEFLRRISAK